MQLESNFRQEAIIWKIQDRNYEQLYALRDEYDDTKSEKLLPRLREAEEEHARWESIYERFGGVRGGDKYVPEIQVTFRPAMEGEDVRLVGDAIIGRSGEMTRKEISLDSRKDVFAKVIRSMEYLVVGIS